MDVLITGGAGMVGTAILEHLDDEYEITILDTTDHPEYDTEVASVTEYDEIRPFFDGVDAVIHLAVYAPGLYDENWGQINEVNINGTYNVMEACRDAGVEKFIFSSTNHVVGLYEEWNRPDIYYPDSGIVVDHTDPVAPDSYYAVSKLLGEHLGQFYVEKKSAPDQFYALRICSLRSAEYDHPYGDAERQVEEGTIERGSEEYEEAVARMKAMWFSRRDCAQLIGRMLHDRTVEFDVFYGVSGNSRRWHDITNAKERLGYSPQDNGEQWSSPP